MRQLRKIKVCIVGLLCSIISLNIYASSETNLPKKLKEKLPVNAKVVSSKVKNINNKDYMFIKYLDKKDLKGTIFNNEGKEILENDIKTSPVEMLGKELKNKMRKVEKSYAGAELINVNIALNIEEVEISKPPVEEEVIIDGQGKYSLKRNNSFVTEKEEKTIPKLSGKLY